MILLLKMKISGIPDLLYMFPIFSDFLQNRSDRGGGAGGDQKSSFAIKPVMDIPPPPPNIDPKGGVKGIK